MPDTNMHLALLPILPAPQIQAERILKLQQLAASQQQQQQQQQQQPALAPRPVRWLIMTSPFTHADTLAHFEQHSFFGLQRSQVGGGLGSGRVGGHTCMASRALAQAYLRNFRRVTSCRLLSAACFLARSRMRTHDVMSARRPMFMSHMTTFCAGHVLPARLAAMPHGGRCGRVVEWQCGRVAECLLPAACACCPLILSTKLFIGMVASLPSRMHTGSPVWKLPLLSTLACIQAARDKSMLRCLPPQAASSWRAAAPWQKHRTAMVACTARCTKRACWARWLLKVRVGKRGENTAWHWHQVVACTARWHQAEPSGRVGLTGWSRGGVWGRAGVCSIRLEGLCKWGLERTESTWWDGQQRQGSIKGWHLAAGACLKCRAGSTSDPNAHWHTHTHTHTYTHSHTPCRRGVCGLLLRGQHTCTCGRPPICGLLPQPGCVPHPSPFSSCHSSCQC